MNRQDKKIAMQKIQEVLDQHDYPFRNREDFVESRYSWQDLADSAEAFYWVVLALQDIFKKEKVNETN